MRSAYLLLIFILSSGFFVETAQGVIILSGDGSGNTSVPSDDPGWGHVVAGGVHIGNGWYLTANHAAPAGATQLTTDVGGTTVGADLAVYRGADLGTPGFALASTTAAIGSQVTLIGNGRNRETSLTEWNGTWVEKGTSGYTGPAVYSGYKWQSTSAKRWGENIVSDNAMLVELGATKTDSITTTFDANGISHESQGATGDSGGALFRKTGSGWELAGIIYAIGQFDDQPQAAVFGNVTHAADIASYRSQIESVVTSVPEPSACFLVGLVAVVAGVSQVKQRLGAG